MTERYRLGNDNLYNPVGRETGLTAECPNCGELIPVFGYTCGYCGCKVRVEFVAEKTGEEAEEFVPAESTEQ